MERHTNVNKEEHLLRSRFTELSRIAYERGYITFTNFLNLNEQSILRQSGKDALFLLLEFFGGYNSAERQMAAFIPDGFFTEPSGDRSFYPISAVSVTLSDEKFSKDTLTHRDYLGAILHLGLDRSKIGDILMEASRTIIFVHSDVEQFVCSELTRVKHSSVNVTPVDLSEIVFSQKYEAVSASVASPRLDAVIACAFRLSRTKATPFVLSGKVFVNGKEETRPDITLKTGDLVSCRGLGKFSYEGEKNRTKKGRTMIELHRFV